MNDNSEPPSRPGLRFEIKAFATFLKNYGNEVAIFAVAMLMLSLNRYHLIHEAWLSTFIYLGIIPLLFIIFVLRKNPLDFGLRWGKPRVWLPLTAVFCGIAAVTLIIASFIPELQNYYVEENQSLAVYSLTTVIALSASEFFYRGFLIFGLKEKFGAGVILIQSIPFVIMHLGKPELETVSTIFTGLMFGWVAYRGNSFWPAFIVHIFINIFFVALVNLRGPV